MYAKFDNNNRAVHVVGFLTEDEDPSNWVEVDDALMSAKQIVRDNGVIRAATDEEFEAFVEESRLTGLTVSARFKRDQLLAESDILVAPDRWEFYTAEQQAALSAYRQALRDMPEQPGFPADAVFPEKPTL